MANSARHSCFYFLSVAMRREKSKKVREKTERNERKFIDTRQRKLISREIRYFLNKNFKEINSIETGKQRIFALGKKFLKFYNSRFFRVQIKVFVFRSSIFSVFSISLRLNCNMQLSIVIYRRVNSIIPLEGLENVRNIQTRISPL